MGGLGCLLLIIALIFFPPLAGFIGILFLTIGVIAIVSLLERWLSIGSLGAMLVAFSTAILLPLLIYGSFVIAKEIDWEDPVESFKQQDNGIHSESKYLVYGWGFYLGLWLLVFVSNGGQGMSFFISALILLLLLICGSVVIAKKFDWGDLTERAKERLSKKDFWLRYGILAYCVLLLSSLIFDIQIF